jgi:hypothetical protein
MLRLLLFLMTFRLLIKKLCVGIITCLIKITFLDMDYGMLCYIQNVNEKYGLEKVW